MKGNFLADECVWQSLIEELRRRGCQVRSMREMSFGTPDTDVLGMAAGAREILITEDSDFGELIFLKHRPAHGVLVIPFSRFRGARPETARTISDRIETIADRLVGALTVIEPDRTRQRAIETLGASNN